MKYLEITNNEITGYGLPQSYGEAVEFVKEVEEVCKVSSVGEGIIDTGKAKKKVRLTNYKYQDGTRFAVSYDAKNEIVEIEVQDLYMADFGTAYYNPEFYY
jgi:hypothetical protein